MEPYPAMSVKILLAMGAAEKGICSHWSQVHAPCNPGNTDGIMQVTDSTGRKYDSGYAYNDTYGGYEGNVNDAIAYLNDVSGYAMQGIEETYTPMDGGKSIRLLLYYNAGSNPRGTYLEGLQKGYKPGDPEWIWGNPQYLHDVAEQLRDSPFGPNYNDPILAAELEQAQDNLNLWLNDQMIKSGHPEGYHP